MVLLSKLSFVLSCSCANSDVTLVLSEIICCPLSSFTRLSPVSRHCRACSTLVDHPAGFFKVFFVFLHTGETPSKDRHRPYREAGRDPVRVRAGVGHTGWVSKAWP